MAWAFDPDLTQVLLVDHPTFHVLLPPGGRVEAGEHPEVAVLRELREETGLVGCVRDDRPALLDCWRGEHAGERIETYGLAFVVEVDHASPLAGEPQQPVAWLPLGDAATPPDRAETRHWRRVHAAAVRLRAERTARPRRRVRR